MSTTPQTVVPRPHANRIAPPGFIYTAVGKLVPVCPPTGARPVVRKLLIVLPYYDGDKAEAEDLAGLICDLERVRVKEADIMVMQRYDAHPFDSSLLQRLGDKFEKVHAHTCRLRDGVGHPFGANQMWYDVVAMFAQVNTWNNAYYAFLFLEPDCVPTRPGWIAELASAFQEAQANRGKAVIGFIHDNPAPHVNGVAVYAIDVWRKAPGNKLGGGNPQRAFDIDKGPILLPMAEDSPLFWFEYRKPTITPVELFAPRKKGVVPALFHGVKDASARQAVRARFVTFQDKAAGPRPNVYTFYQPVNPGQDPENQSILRLWLNAWKAAGFNPVVLKGLDAGKNAHYVGFSTAIGKFPTVLEKQQQLNRFLRWVALETAGGGILVEYDVLPGKIRPEGLIGLKGFHLARPREVFNLAAAVVDRPALGKWLDRIQNYDPQPDDMIGERRNVSDINVMRRCASEDGVVAEDWIKNFGEPNWQDAPMIHFNSVAIAHSASRSERKSQLMERYLRGDVDWLMAKTVEPEAPPPTAAISVESTDLNQRQEADPDAVKELYDENEVLRTENEALKAKQADIETKLAGIEKAMSEAAVEVEKPTRRYKRRKAKRAPKETAPTAPVETAAT